MACDTRTRSHKIADLLNLDMFMFSVFQKVLSRKVLFTSRQLPAAENQMCPNPSSRDIRYIWHVAHAVLVVSGVHVSVSHKASIVAVADWCVLSF